MTKLSSRYDGLLGSVGAGHLFLGLALIVVAARGRLVTPATLATPLTLLDRLFDLLLIALLGWLAAALGRRLLGRLGLTTTTTSPAERLLIGTGLGLGAIAYLLLALGLAGLLNGLAIAVMLGGTVLVAAPSLTAVAEDVQHCRSALGQQRPATSLLLLAGLALAATFLLTLVPPVTYDGLAYHLAGPRDWLALGRLAPLLDNPPANFPATAELLYALLMLFGSDSAPQMLHWSFGLLSAGLVGLATTRLGGQRAGWLAALTFLSSPAITLFAWHANIDLAVTLVEGLAGYALLRALTSHATEPGVRRQPPDRRWLLVSGLGLGLALGLKYVALGTLALASLVLLLALCYGRRRRSAAAADLLTLITPALLVGAPWYIKNWLWLGNPVWPTFFGGRGWDAVRLANFTRYSQAIGHPVGWPDSLLLPLRLYTGDHENPLAIPSLLYLLLPLLLLTPRQPGRLIGLGLGAAGFLLWSLGLREIRLLFPTLALLSVPLGLLLAAPPRRLSGARARGWLTGFLPHLALVTALVPPLFFVGVLQPWRPLLGLEARTDFLARYNNQTAYTYVNDQAPAGGRTLLIGDGRLYYLDGPTRSDIFRDAVPSLLAAGESPADWHRWLIAGGYTHVIISQRDLEFVATYTPPAELARQEALLARLTTIVLEPVFTGRAAVVYRVRATLP